MPTFYGAIDLSKNELRNAVMQNLGSAPATPVLGQMYFNSADGTLYYCTNVVGPIWTAAKAGAGATPASSVTTSAVGDAAVVGTGSNFAREDHKHGREAFGAVTAETSAFGSASANGAATSLARSDHTHGNPTHDAAAHSAIPLSALAVPTTDINLNTHKIINGVDPTNPQDFGTKAYIDNAIAGLAWKDSVRLASTANIASLSGTAFTVDGSTPAVGDRVLAKNQTLSRDNGIYVAAAGAWTRATDADAGAEVLGMAAYVESGSTNVGTTWVCTATGPAASIVIGSSALPFAQFGGGATYSAGAGLTLTGTVIDAVAGDSSLVVNADEMHVNTAVIATAASVTAAVTGLAKKFAAALTGTASPETVTHNLNTRDIAVTVLNGGTPYTAVEVDWDATTVNTATIRYNPNLGAGYRVVVTG